MSEAVRTNVYVDGFNLYYRALRRPGARWLNLESYFDALLPRNTVEAIHYFTARVKPRPGDADAAQRQQAYLHALATLPRVNIHYGQFQVKTVQARLATPDPTYPEGLVSIIKTEEKGSDVNLAVRFVADAFRDIADAYVLVTNDSDLAEPLRLVRQDLGRTVGLINTQVTPSRQLMNCQPSFVKQVRPELVRACQFDDPVAGTNLRKPTDW